MKKHQRTTRGGARQVTIQFRCFQQCNINVTTNPLCTSYQDVNFGTGGFGLGCVGATGGLTETPLKKEEIQSTVTTESPPSHFICFSDSLLRNPTDGTPEEQCGVTVAKPAAAGCSVNPSNPPTLSDRLHANHNVSFSIYCTQRKLRVERGGVSNKSDEPGTVTAD